MTKKDETNRPTLGLTATDVRNFSLIRLLNAQLAHRERGIPMEDAAPFEVECSNAMASELGVTPRGAFIPPEVLDNGQWAMRAPPADTVENASLVPEDHLASSFITALRANTTVGRLGATVLDGLRGDVSIPREDAVVVEWLSEDESSTDVDLVTDAVTLKPTTVAASVPMTRRLLKQSSPAVELLVRSNIATGIAVEVDRAALDGSGVAPIPTGILQQAGVLTSTVADASGDPTWSETVAFISALAGANTLTESAAWVAHPDRMTAMRTTTKDAGSGQFIWGDDNQVAGYRAEATNNMPSTNGILFGDFANLLIGMWGSLDILMDPYSKAASGGLHVRCFQDTDIAVRRGAYFCKAA